MSNYRNPKLLKLAKDQPCMLCGAQDGTVVAAHSNWSEHGKGMSIKAHDCFIAFLCHMCHAEIDQGSRLTKEERKDQWRLAHDRTMLSLFQNDHLMVASALSGDVNA